MSDEHPAPRPAPTSRGPPATRRAPWASLPRPPRASRAGAPCRRPSCARGTPCSRSSSTRTRRAAGAPPPRATHAAAATNEGSAPPETPPLPTPPRAPPPSLPSPHQTPRALAHPGPDPPPPLPHRRPPTARPLALAHRLGIRSSRPGSPSRDSRGSDEAKVFGGTWHQRPQSHRGRGLSNATGCPTQEQRRPPLP